MGKIGLVVEGGGMKCAYSAGILDCFLENNISFDYSIGVSAGSANISSFLANQKERNLRFYTQHVKDSEYISVQNFLLHGEIFGLDYIYGELSNSTGKDPLDFQAIVDNPCEFEMVATDSKTGKAVYFNKGDLRQDNYTPIMASSALPVFCNPVSFLGCEYFDGGISDAIPFQRALKQGCEKVVVLLSKPRSFIRKPEAHKSVYSKVLRNYPKIIKAIDRRYIMYRNQIAKLKRLEAEGKLFVFAPSKNIKLNTIAMDPVGEQSLYDLGLDDYKSREEKLLKFLGSMNK